MPETKKAVNKNAKCPNCNADVIYYQCVHESGRKFAGYFDNISRSPWEWHSCDSKVLTFGYKKPFQFMKKLEIYDEKQIEIQFKILFIHAMALHFPREVNSETLKQFKKQFKKTIEKLESILSQRNVGKKYYEHYTREAKHINTISTLPTLTTPIEIRDYLQNFQEHWKDVFLAIPKGAWLIVRPPNDPMLKSMYAETKYKTLTRGMEIYLKPPHRGSKSRLKTDERMAFEMHIAILVEFLVKYQDYLEDADATINAVLDLQEEKPKKHRDKGEAKKYISYEILRLYQDREQIPDENSYMKYRKRNRIEESDQNLLEVVISSSQYEHLFGGLSIT